MKLLRIRFPSLLSIPSDPARCGTLAFLRRRGRGARRAVTPKLGAANLRRTGGAKRSAAQAQDRYRMAGPRSIRGACAPPWGADDVPPRAQARFDFVSHADPGRLAQPL